MFSPGGPSEFVPGGTRGNGAEKGVGGTASPFSY